jgi:hypothetical protein
MEVLPAISKICVLQTFARHRYRLTQRLAIRPAAGTRTAEYIVSRHPASRWQRQSHTFKEQQ